MSLYEFDPEDAVRFARSQNIKTRQRGQELIFAYCPYCGGTSGGSRKIDKETFSINMTTGQWECKRSKCGLRGNMITLSRDFDNFSLGDDVDRYYLQRKYAGNRFRSFKAAHQESKPAAIEYLQKRGISAEVTEKYEITTQKNNDSILVFPFYNENNELKFIKYRNTAFVKGETDGSKEWCERDCMPILFGMNHCNTENKTLIITEGQIDSLSVTEAGFDNAVSVPTGCNGFTWVPHCWDWLQNFNELIIFGDCENERITLTELGRKFNGLTKVVRKEDYLDCKDANEILQKYGASAITKAIQKAEPIPVKGIVDLAKVKSVNLEDIEKVSTKMKKIDSILSGGIHVGELILLSGNRGDGKSTFMGQLIANAIEKWNCFAYSGELVDFMFKDWIVKQISGKKKLFPTEAEKMDEFLQGKIYLYDSDSIEGNETEALLQMIEKAIKQYGCKLICIDNLMTAMDAESNETLYRSQSMFVGKLKKIAQVFDVAVILVAHPRKSNGKTNVDNDDVSGTGDITNKADVVMFYSRIKEEKESDENIRELKITKNRLTGRLTNERRRIYLRYDAESKRIVDDLQSFDYSTGWNDGEDVNRFSPVDDEECPF